MSREVQVEVNGTPRALPAGASVVDAVAAVSDRPTGVAVAVNGEVVPRGQWPLTHLRAGDRVEVLTAVQGG